MVTISITLSDEEYAELEKRANGVPKGFPPHPIGYPIEQYLRGIGSPTQPEPRLDTTKAHDSSNPND